MADAKRLAPTAIRKKRNVLQKYWELYLLLLFPVAILAVFNYAPMYGIQLAFRENNIAKGITGGDWVGLHYFQMFFKTYNWASIIWNTFYISLVGLLISFPFPIILAILMNEIQARRFKKVVQTITYAPHFISTVVIVGMLMMFMDPRAGVINKLLEIFGFKAVNFMSQKSAFVWIYTFSGVWQSAGFSSIIYLSALTGVDPQLQEAAAIDGADRLRRIWHINLPAILPTISILLILSLSGLMSVGFEKIFLMQNPTNLSVSEVISTLVYKQGMEQANYSYATAVGLMNTVVNFLLLLFFNTIARLTKQASWF